MRNGLEMRKKQPSDAVTTLARSNISVLDQGDILNILNTH